MRYYQKTRSAIEGQYEMTRQST